MLTVGELLRRMPPEQSGEITAAVFHRIGELGGCGLANSDDCCVCEMSDPAPCGDMLLDCCVEWPALPGSEDEVNIVINAGYDFKTADEPTNVTVDEAVAFMDGARAALNDRDDGEGHGATTPRHDVGSPLRAMWERGYALIWSRP